MSKRDVIPVVGFLACASLTVIVGVIGANATPRPFTELGPGEPLRVRISSDREGFSFLHPTGAESASLLELPVARALDIEMMPSTTPRTLRIDALGLVLRGARRR